MTGTGQAAGRPPGAARTPGLWRRRVVRLLGILGCVYLATGAYQALKPLPTGLSMAGAPHLLEDGDLEFLADLTYRAGDQRRSEQAIFDRVLGLIRGAEDFILADFFLFNDYLGNEREVHRRLTREISEALLQRRRERPGMSIVVLTDPVNEAYGGTVPEPLAALRAAGIPVVPTDLAHLRDSNPAYSAFWRLGVQWLGTSRGGVFPHPFDRRAEGVGLRSWLQLLNFKANHRKLIVADAPDPRGGREMVAMVLSANPHDGSSAHGNVALLARGTVWRDLVRSEQAVLDFSAPGMDLARRLPGYAAERNGGGRPVGRLAVRVLTEARIRDGLLEAVRGTQSGDALEVAMFYLSERRVVEALEAAAGRGVGVRLLLDPNRDAFGYRKNGIPNRSVAAELLARGEGKIQVRWYDTHGEQFHTKMVLVRRGDQAVLLAGSANLTRRNLADFNLETDLEVSGDRDAAVFRAARDYFERLWSNRDRAFSLPAEAYAEPGRAKYWTYRFQEWGGLSTF